MCCRRSFWMTTIWRRVRSEDAGKDPNLVAVSWLWWDFEEHPQRSAAVSLASFAPFLLLWLYFMLCVYRFSILLIGSCMVCYVIIHLWYHMLLCIYHISIHISFILCRYQRQQSTKCKGWRVAAPHILSRWCGAVLCGSQLRIWRKVAGEWCRCHMALERWICCSCS